MIVIDGILGVTLLLVVYLLGVWQGSRAQFNEDQKDFDLRLKCYREAGWRND